MAPTPDDSAQ
ncbi:Hypothetical protein PFREUD_18620 [Propionibacterium freudenreichii subsp. shermanii CIRM-BIA1]|uniref:Uncharacterized protein n=1 Tax=Propionibacterium freudenreichii subsp. shermanii (strain ATCC 9614 / DSM 4902 / CIP 103027 / NCIMB 8099 / CIRM-BIA1) TaxID=754252 RepID=D7GFP3_PROFC|nr:Hypothetical protein PFREUD_18620 [Propionibacterium freudenreichii subsp. shermanii CIRM-BIA1]